MTAQATPSAPASRGSRLLPQIVSSAACLRCDVCCRFPDPDSPLRPYFTGREIDEAVAGGIERRWFPSPNGGQVSLVPDEGAEGYHCPAFDATTNRCRIYEHRPLDCRLYPLALMWNERHDEVLLGWDAKCPFMREQVPVEITEHADRVVSLLAQQDFLDTVARHPHLIGRFQEDVVHLRPLPDVTRAVSQRWGNVPMHRLTLDDLPRLETALRRAGLPQSQSPAAYSAPYHYTCNTLLSYWWTELDGGFFLFAESPDGWFMPLPPLSGGPIDDACAQAFAILRQRNDHSAVSRIENVLPEAASHLRLLGYRSTPKEGDYLYRADELSRLVGDRYKSQRALCNRIDRLTGIAVVPYQECDRRACRTLLHVWRGQKEGEALGSYGRWLLEDAVSSHEVVWSHAAALGLNGTVVKIDGAVRAYTFGYWLTDKTWCVLLEVADRTVPGLAQYLFRETCRLAHSEGAEFVNAMDDAGLPGLRRSKQRYRPTRQIESVILREDLPA
jgi:Fe-S-cluster containining protein